jgi:SAM-dependent methyltransferase
MSTSLYSDPALYDIISPPEPFASFYAEHAARQSGAVLEIACGTGSLLVPIAQHGLRTVGLDISPGMLAAARVRAEENRTSIEWVHSDMRQFDLQEQFRLVFLARNSLLQLHTRADLLDCFSSIRKHLMPDGRFIFDIFNPDVKLLARPVGERFFVRTVRHPHKGEITLEQVNNYDAAAQVNRATWYFSTSQERDFLVVPLHLRSIFPEELPLLVAMAGLHLEVRYGDFSQTPFTGSSRQQVCICRSA